MDRTHHPKKDPAPKTRPVYAASFVTDIKVYIVRVSFVQRQYISNERSIKQHINHI